MAGSGGRFGGLISARGSWVVCSLLLASTLLAGCNLTGSSASSDSASATTGTSTATASSPGTAASAGSGAPQGTTTDPATTDKTADVSWTPPTTYTNGSALTDLAGYTIYYGTSPSALTKTIDVANAGATDYVVQGLTAGTWYFAVTAYTNTGLQSSFSTIVSKTIT